MARRKLGVKGSHLKSEIFLIFEENVKLRADIWLKRSGENERLERYSRRR